MAGPFRRQVFYAVVLTVLLAVLAPIQPKLVQFTLDNHIMQGDYNGLLRMTIILTIVLLARSLTLFAHTYVTNWLGQSVIRRLRVNVFKHISSLKLRFFDRTPVGTMVTRSVNDIETIAEIFSQGIIQIVGEVLQLVVNSGCDVRD